MLHRLIGAIVIAVSFIAAWLMMDYRQFSDAPLNLPEEGVVYSLLPGTSLKGLASEFEQKKWLSSALYLRVMARLDENSAKIKAGEYRIPKGTTPRGLLALFVSGKVTHYSMTIVEGWSFRQMLAAIQKNGEMKHTLEGLSDEEIMKRLGHEGEHPEGRFLPDTYHFSRGTTDMEFLKRAYNAMQQTLHREWDGREKNLPLKTPYEALILASIIEKETGLASERPEIAGVFVRRLNKGMKLQTDPTVIYGMGESFDGNIRRRDLRQDTPYNTYVHKGLTPTPISLPGADAIKAALHPAKGKSLYFVATSDGGHKFSTTLSEHNAAVRKYQLKK
ncbi:endolytic transglycosylase MltG [Solemya velesiana gill symbiont]|uniref:Endolytic murein transglycosylase n=1 Tax=Solemya velesiana gill symbiont TaxID=1918948 RepID=A0A1T2KT01_9GAMM|nr:endolytic transglycosylase MltG [Solemya velesiana gill symbiont]OOZ35860.1 aminodeoxychorismate lyase [Solemya velesiana gill symbiont]